MSLNCFIQSWRDVRIVERSVQIIAQAILDIAGHIIASKGWGTPSSYKEGILKLVQHEVIDKSLGFRLANLVGMRNILVHEYQVIDRKLVHAAIAQIIEDGPQFTRQVLNLIEES